MARRVRVPGNQFLFNAAVVEQVLLDRATSAQSQNREALAHAG
jgi:hypothetical protein